MPIQALQVFFPRLQRVVARLLCRRRGQRSGSTTRYSLRLAQPCTSAGCTMDCLQPAKLYAQSCMQTPCRMLSQEPHRDDFNVLGKLVALLQYLGWAGGLFALHPFLWQQACRLAQSARLLWKHTCKLARSVRLHTCKLARSVLLHIWKLASLISTFFQCKKEQARQFLKEREEARQWYRGQIRKAQQGMEEEAQLVLKLKKQEEAQHLAWQRQQAQLAYEEYNKNRPASKGKLRHELQSYTLLACSNASKTLAD